MESGLADMVTEGKRLFGCPQCGFRVGIGDRSCPRCSSKFDPTTKFECPFCGEFVPANSDSCPHCHVDYVDFRERTVAKAKDSDIDSLLMEIIRLEAEEVKSQQKKLSCPYCSWLIDGTEESCPKCGYSFIATVRFQCPVCAGLVDADASSCPECGSSFDTEEGAPAQPTTAWPEPEIARPAPAVVPNARPQPEPPRMPEKVEHPVALQPEKPPELVPAPVEQKKPTKQRKLKAKPAPKKA